MLNNVSNHNEKLHIKRTKIAPWTLWFTILNCEQWKLISWNFGICCNKCMLCYFMSCLQPLFSERIAELIELVIELIVVTCLMLF